MQRSLVRSGKYFVGSFFRELMPDKTAFLPILESLAKVDETVVRE